MVDINFSLMSFLEKGGPSVWAIFVAAFFLFIIGVERVVSLFGKLSKNSKNALQSIRTHVLNRNYTQAIQVCNEHITAPDLTVVKAGLLAVENGREAMRSSLSGAVLSVSHKCEKRLPYISLIANIATLLGLLGTISGLVKTFKSLSDVDPSKKAQMLGNGISEAMTSTMAGLIVGITAMAIYTFCVSKSDAIVGQAQDTGFKLVTWVEQSERGDNG